MKVLLHLIYQSYQPTLSAQHQQAVVVVTQSVCGGGETMSVYLHEPCPSVCMKPQFVYADDAPAELCQAVCMVQIFPSSKAEAVSSCPACILMAPEPGFQQYDVVHALLEGSVHRNSYIPMVMRLRWFPTTSGPQFADAGLQVNALDRPSGKCTRSSSEAP